MKKASLAMTRVDAGEQPDPIQDGYRLLATAVLELGKRELLSSDDEIALAAFAWIYGEDEGRRGFEWWCDVLGWPPERVRRRYRDEHPEAVDSLAIRWGTMMAEQSPSALAWELVS